MIAINLGSLALSSLANAGNSGSWVGGFPGTSFLLQIRETHSREMGYPQMRFLWATALHAIGRKAALKSSLIFSGFIKPASAHAPIRSLAQKMISGPLPLGAAAWNLSVMPSCVSTFTETP